MTDTLRTANSPSRRPRLYRTLLGVAVAALVAAWLPFWVFYIEAIHRPAALSTVTMAGGQRLVTTMTSRGPVVRTVSPGAGQHLVNPTPVTTRVS
jgi:hypothetical protein